MLSFHKMVAKISKDMTLSDVVEKYPETVPVMLKFDLHCVGCHVAAYETIEQGAKGHRMSEENLEKMLAEMNKAIEKKD